MLIKDDMTALHKLNYLNFKRKMVLYQHTLKSILNFNFYVFKKKININ